MIILRVTSYVLGTNSSKPFQRSLEFFRSRESLLSTLKELNARFTDPINLMGFKTLYLKLEVRMNDRKCNITWYERSPRNVDTSSRFLRPLISQRSLDFLKNALRTPTIYRPRQTTRSRNSIEFNLSDELYIHCV